MLHVWIRDITHMNTHIDESRHTALASLIALSLSYALSLSLSL